MAEILIPFNDEYTATNPTGRSTGISGFTAWVIQKCKYTTDSATPGAKLSFQIYFVGSGSVSGVKVRFKYEISTDNFSTIRASGYSNETGIISSGMNFTFLNYWGQYITIPGDRGVTYVNDVALSFTKTQYKVRITYQIQWSEGSTWSNGTSDVFTSYAPFGVTITPPANVRLNGINTYTASIPANVVSEFTANTVKGSTSGYNYDVPNPPVRNADPPYITTGTATSNIYWYPQIPIAAATAEGDSAASYKWVCDLKMTDPGGGNFTITVAETTVSGTATWLNTDDTTAIVVSGISFVDLSGAYDTYGYLLRNIGANIRTSVTVNPHYGASYKVVYGQYQYGWIVTLYEGREAGTYTKTEGIDGSSRDNYFEIRVNYTSNHKTILYEDQIFSPSYLRYSIPGLPNFSVHRCDIDGSNNDSGEYVRIEWAISINPIANQNSRKLTIQHSQGSTVYDANSTPPLTSYTQSGILIVAASPESSYTFTATVQDDLNSTTRSVSVSTAGVIRDVLWGGKGVSYGKVAEYQNALEISPLWDLIAYKVKLNGRDLTAWVQEMAARMSAVEQYLSNLGSTTQHQATFYNNTQIYDRQWVLHGGDAVAPSENPSREATGTTTYAFVGWALSNGASSANPNALKNITSNRSIYAAFTSSVRYYSVFFKNAGTLLQTVDQIQYHQNASYSGSTPVDADGGTFIGWKPSGRYIEETKDANAMFYYDQEITDTWEEIVKACANGTYAEKYKPGNWKMLDLGAQGNIKMRVKGLKIHYGQGMKKLPMSWEADTKLATNQVMNSEYAAEQILQPDYEDGFTYDQMYENTSYHQFRYVYLASGEGRSATNKATATIKIKATAATSINLAYEKYGATGGSAYISWAANGVAKQTNKSLTGSLVVVDGDAISLSANQTLTITVETYCSSPDSRCYLQVRDTPTTYVSGQSAITITEFTTNRVGKCIGLTEGRGNIGGFAKSELFAYLQNTIKPLFPEALRNGLKRARLFCATMKSTRDYPNYQYVPDDIVETDLFIPSGDEIVGAWSGCTKGVDMNVLKYQYRKKGNTSSSGNRQYWCRDVFYNNDTYFDVIYGYSNTDGNAYLDELLCNTAAPVYICFCT